MAAVGTAFQIVDDVLGIQGFEGGLKAPCEDLLAGKLSHPVAVAYDRLDTKEKAELRETLANIQSSSHELPRILDMLRRTEALECSRERARQMLLAARSAAVCRLAPTPALKHLCDFTERVLDRVY